MRYLSIFKFLFTVTIIRNSIFSNVKCKLLALKFLLFFSLQISCISIIEAQVNVRPSITICAGEELVLTDFSTPALPPEPVQGAEGTPPITCSYSIERTIGPITDLIERKVNSITVAPLTTITYVVSSIYVPGPQAPDAPYHNSDACLVGPYSDDIFEVIVEECTNTVCNVADPFTELTWLEALVNFEDENGFGYYDYAKLFELNGNSYLEIFSEINGKGSQIYTCDGSLFCDRQNSQDCIEFNEAELVETLYFSNCTSTIDEAQPGDNKIDVEVEKVNYPTSVTSEGSRGFRFELINNGPCRLFETDLVVEMNGTIIDTKKITGSRPAGRTFNINSNEQFYFEPETEYKLRVYTTNPNGNSDLNFTNDTLYKTYFFNRNYSFDIDKFISPQPAAFNGEQEVSIMLNNNSNASFGEAVYVNWSVNGVEQSPALIEDIQGENTLVLGNYFFEVDKDYEINASIEVLSFSNLPLAQITYIVNKNSAVVDLSIAAVNIPTTNPNAIQIKIENNGNVDINDFIFNWTYNGVAQEPIDLSNYNWRWYAEEVFFDKYTTVRIDTFNFDESKNYTFDFSIELPDNYTDINPENNVRTFEKTALLPDEEKLDHIYKICEGDSIFLKVDEFKYYPDAFGISLGCTTCSVSFNNQKWTLNDEIISATNSVIVKPESTSIITFSTDANELCANNCGPGPGGGFSGSYDQPDMRVKIIVEPCQKQPSNCLNYQGEIGYQTDENGNSNRINAYNGDRLIAYDVDGNAIDLRGDYLQFDYEIKGPVIANGDQPVTITCLNEIFKDYNYNFNEYGLCVGDEIETQFKIPADSDAVLASEICNTIKSANLNNEFIESEISNNCAVNFTLIDLPEYNYTSLNYAYRIQTTDRPLPIKLNWNFGFGFKEECVEECLNEPGLMQTSSSFVCAGESVFVREVFSNMDENSTKAYVLHNEKEFDGVNFIAINQNGRFTSQGESHNNQKLYISTVIGTADENGMPNFNDACTVWTPYGAAYTFFDPIKITVIDERCENEGYYIEAKINGGIGNISSKWAYRSVSDGIKTYRNVSADEVITFGPYSGESEYVIVADGTKGCTSEYIGSYNCAVANRKASIGWRGSNIFEVSYTNSDLTIESVKVFNTNGQAMQANTQIDNNSCKIELQNQLNGSLFFAQILVKDSRTGESVILSEKIYKN